MIDPAQLVTIEARGRGVDMLNIEPGDQLLAREHFVVAVSPTEPGEEVDHRLREESGISVLHHADRAVALRQLVPVVAQHRWYMRVHRELAAERLDQIDLPRRIVDVI